MKPRLLLMYMSALLLAVGSSALGAYTTIYTSPDWGYTGYAGVGDADNDGANEIVFSAWNRAAIYSYDGSSFVLDANWTLDDDAGPGVQAAFGIAVGDSDNDGRNNLLFGTWAHKVLGYQYDGSKYAFKGALPWSDYGNWTIRIANTDGAPGNEILVGGRYGNFYGFRSDGSQYTRFYTSPEIGTDRSVWIRGVGNTNGNGQMDVFTYCDQGIVDIWEANGDDFLNVFHKEFDNSPGAIAAGTIYDTDGDGVSEVFYADAYGNLHGVRYNGLQYVQFWTGSVGWCPSELAIGDIDRNGSLELFVGGSAGELSVIGLDDASVVDLGKYPSSVHLSVGDVTGDGAAELVVAVDDGRFHVIAPEPSTLALLSMSALGLLVYAWREGRRRAKSAT